LQQTITANLYASKVTQEINQSFPDQLSEFASKTQNSIENFNTLTERFNTISGNIGGMLK
jgi:hypothetical protein